MNGWPLTVFAPPSVTPACLRAVARSWLSRTPRAGLILVDYLQLMDADNSKKSGTRAEEVGRMAWSLKVLAREAEVPVLCLAQLSREADKGGPPKLGHLRESGAIEQHSDKVWFLHRPEFENREGVRVSKPNEKSQIIVAKFRNGPLGVVDTQYRQCVGFVDADQPERVAAFDEWNEGASS
jgi:replicative DNA helicase